MALAIVVLLEVVDIDHRHGDVVPVACGALDLHLQVALEVAAVVETGQLIDEREFFRGAELQRVLDHLPRRHGERLHVGDVRITERSALITLGHA